MSRRLQLSRDALNDIRVIWQYTAQTFDRRLAREYHSLIKQAFADIVEEPTLIGSPECPEFGEGFRSYRLALSAKRSGTEIKRPRHVIIYMQLHEDRWGVVRILHESMDAGRHIPSKSIFDSD